MPSQVFRPSPRTTRDSSVARGRRGSDCTRRSDDTLGPLPSLLNRSENMAKQKVTKDCDSSIHEAHIILSKHKDLGYIPFLSAGNQLQKDAQAQFAAARELYQLPHPVGVVLTYSTLCKYYADASVAKVWKKAVEDWQALGDKTRNLNSSHHHQGMSQLYGRDEKTFEKERNRSSLMESYMQREQNMRSLAKRTGNKSLGAFDATAFANLTFQEAATNDIVLNIVFLANSASDKLEQFQTEKNDKYMDFVIAKKQQKIFRDEPDEMDLFLAELEADMDKKGIKRHKRPDERDPKKALVHTSAMVLTRTIQQATKSLARNLRPM